MLDLDRAKGAFVSAVSHELRTPLTSADFESTPGVGTTFRILLPIRAPVGVLSDADQERDESTDGEPAELR